MRTRILLSMIAVLTGCASGPLDERSVNGSASAPDTVLVYEGPHWAKATYVDEIGEEEVLHGACAGSAEELQTDRFFDVMIDLAPACGDADPVSYQVALSLVGLERNGTTLSFMNVVHVSRDGFLFVEDGDWSAYADASTSAPAWTGELAGDELELATPLDIGSFDGETWSLSAGPLDASTGCPAGAVHGTVTYPDGVSCPVQGTLTFTSVIAEPRDGAVYITGPDDGGDGD